MAALSAITFACAFAQPAPPSLTYEAALALSASAPAVQLAEATLEQRERQAAAAGAPFDLAMSAGYRGSRSTTHMQADVDPVAEDAVGFDPIGLQVTVDPALGGASRDERERAADAVAAARDELASALRSARIDVVAAFQDALFAEASLDVAVAERALAVSDLEAVRARYERGAASDLDLAQADLAVAQASHAVQAAERELTLANTLLGVTLGQDVVAAAGPLPSPPPVPPLPGTPPAALEARPDVAAVLRAVADADRTAAASVRDVLPVLSFDAQYRAGNEHAFLNLGASVDTTRLTPTVSLSVDPDTGLIGLGEGGSRTELQLGVALTFMFSPALRDALAVVQIGQAQARTQAATVRQQAELALLQAHALALGAAERALYARGAAELAHERVRVATLRLEAGSGTRAALDRARIDAARADLDAARREGEQRLAVFRFLDALAAPPEALE